MQNISDIVVKINCKREVGSGFIYKPQISSDCIYIFTARHCIFGKKNNNQAIKTDIRIDFFDTKNNLKATYNVNSEDDLIYGDNNKYEDIAIIIIHKNNLKEYNIDNIKTPICFSLRGDEEGCFINGYPKVVSNKFPMTLFKCLFTPDKNEYPIQVEISDIVAIENPNHDELVEGYSGSGVFVDLVGRLFVCGIVSMYKEETRRFYCNDFLLVNKILSRNSYDEIPLVEIETNTDFINCLEKMNDDWFKSHVEVATNNLGERYTSELNFELDIAKIFDGITRNEALKRRFRNSYDYLFIKADDFLKYNTNPFIISLINDLKVQLSQIKQSFDVLDVIGIKHVPFEKLIDELYALRKLCYDINEKYHKEEEKLQTDRNDYRYYQKYGHEIDKINKLRYQVSETIDFLDSTTSKLVNKPILILDGEAGIGKSHLVADVANNQIRQGYKTLLLLGQHFSSNNSPWIQLLSLLGTTKNIDVFLKTLNFLGEEQKSRLIIFIDAINEGNGRFFWKETIQGFITKIAKYEWIGLVLSIRTTYTRLILPENNSIEDLIVRHKHIGFRNVEYEASKLFFKNYGIQQPSIPLLHPEFQNPLFLRVFCEGLKRFGHKKIPDGFQGISNIINFYLKAIDKKLSEPNSFNYSNSLKLAEKSAKKLIAYKLNKNHIHTIPYDEAYDVILDIENKYRIRNNYLGALISEGILTKNIHYNDDNEIVFITYERFEDHLSVEYLLEGITKNQIISEFEENGKLNRFCSNTNFLNIHRGLYEAFAIQLPEKYGLEIYEVLKEKDLNSHQKITVAEIFISSLLWRNHSTLSKKLLDYINEVVLRYKSTHISFFDSIISIAANPNHYFNADKTHEFLKKHTLSERDGWWTQLIHYWYTEDTALKRLIDWSWSREDKSHISNEGIRLSAVMLSWFLTSTNRTLRDSASKGIICLLVDRIPVLLKVLKQFEDVNDPYIYERLYGCAYGCVLRTKQTDKLKPLAKYIYETIFNQDEIYPHILLRDYARGIIEFTMSTDTKLDINVEKILPPYKSNYPKVFPKNEEIDALKHDYKEKQPFYYYSLNSILSSMVTEYGRGTSFYGDFGRYTFERALSNWKVNANLLSNWCIKTIIEKYGYDIEKHGEFDGDIKNSSYNRYEVLEERIGKKYQWIAMFEILARVSDNIEEFEIPYNGGNDKYEGTWEPFVRDFEPTILFNDKFSLNDENRWWFSDEYSFQNIEHRKWLSIINDIPNIKTIIHSKDKENIEWLNLKFSPSWEEPKIFGKTRYDVPHKDMYFNIHGYFIKEAELENFIEWGNTKNFYNNDMPRNNSHSQIFYRESYNSKAYNHFLKEINQWEEVDERVLMENEPNTDIEIQIKPVGLSMFELPDDALEHFMTVNQNQYSINKIGEVHIPYEEYVWEVSNDGSKKDRVDFYKPSIELFNGLNLNFSEQDGEFYNEEGIVCFDPAANYETQSSFLVRKDVLEKFLLKNGLKLVWFVRGEKRIIGGRDMAREFYENFKTYQRFSGFYYLDNDGIIQGNISAIKEEEH